MWIQNLILRSRYKILLFQIWANDFSLEFNVASKNTEEVSYELIVNVRGSRTKG